MIFSVPDYPDPNQCFCLKLPTELLVFWTKECSFWRSTCISYPTKRNSSSLRLFWHFVSFWAFWLGPMLPPIESGWTSIILDQIMIQFLHLFVANNRHSAGRTEININSQNNIIFRHRLDLGCVWRFFIIFEYLPLTVSAFCVFWCLTHASLMIPGASRNTRQRVKTYRTGKAL